MQKFLYWNVFKIYLITILLLINLCPLFPADADAEKELTLRQKAYLKEMEVSTDDDLRKWAINEGISETDISKIKELLLKKFGIDPKFFMTNNSDSGDRYKILIESTDDLENFIYETSTNDKNEEIIILKGKVSLTIEDTKDNLKHNIKADRIFFNRNNKKLSSNGNIQYSLDLGSNDKVYFYGSELFVDFDSQNFLLKEGVVQKKINKDSTDHIISFGGNVLRKLDNNTILLKDAFITSSKIPDPYYSIKASKIWVLPSGDFGFLNAVFYMGKVPIFYFPFFFKPGDKLFFNPSLGYNLRKGISFFNTIYLFGSNSDTKNDSFLDFNLNSLFNSGKEKYLRNAYMTYFMAEDKSVSENKDYLKFDIDLYSSLGFYFALDFNLSNSFSWLKTFNGIFGIGLTRTLYEYKNGTFLPFKSDSLENSIFSFNNLNKSNIFGVVVPFRYLIKNKIDFVLLSSTFSFNFEYYSDPYVNIDFNNRLENSTFFSLLNTQSDLSETDYKIKLFTWNLSSIYNRSFDQNTSLEYRLDKLGLDFKASDYTYGLTVDKSKELEDPTSRWFYADSFYFPKLDLNFQKSIYNSNLITNKTEQDIAIKPNVRNVELNKENSANSKISKDELVDSIISPKSIALGNKINQNLFSLKFGISPYIQNNIFFDDSNIESPQKFDYKIKNYLFNFKNKTDLTAHLDLYNKLFVLDNIIYLNTYEYNPLDSNFNLISANKSSEHSIINKTILSIYPFRNFSSFSRSLIKYDNKLNLYGFASKYDRINGLSNSHNSIFISSPNTFYQNIDTSFFYDYDFFTANLSSTIRNTFEESYYTSKLNFIFEFKYLYQEIGIGVKYDKKNDVKLLEMFPPLYYKISANYYDYFNLKFLFSYDPIIQRVAEISSELNIYDFKFIFTAKDEFKLAYNSLIGDFFKVNSSKELVPYEFKALYKADIYTFEFFDKKFELGLGIDSGWKMNLQKFTDNELWAELVFKFKYLSFFEVYLSSRSNNTKTYRYFEPYTSQIGIPTVNFFEDLFNSFNFFNIEARKSSFFKIKRFTAGIKLNFYDWQFVSEYSILPDLILKSDGTYSYIWRNTFNIYISWNFFPTIKSSFESNKETDYELIINRPKSK